VLRAIQRQWYLTSWAAFVALTVGAFLVAPPNADDNPIILTTIVCLAMAVVTVPAALAFSHRVLSAWCRTIPTFVSCPGINVEAAFRRQLRFFRGSPGMYAFGFMMGLLCAALTYRYVMTVNLDNMRISAGLAKYQVLVVFVSDFFAGIGIYAMFCLCLAVWRLGKLPGCAVRPDLHQFGVLSAGNALFKVWSAAAGVWFFYVVAMGVAFETMIPLKQIVTSPIVTVVALPTTLFIMGAFVVCQIPLHNRMVASKRGEVLRLQSLLDELMPTAAAAITDEVMKKRHFVEEQMQHAQALPEWPFTRRAVFGTAISAAMSSVPSLFLGSAVKVLLEYAPRIGQ